MAGPAIFTPSTARLRLREPGGSEFEGYATRYGLNRVACLRNFWPAGHSGRPAG